MDNFLFTILIIVIVWRLVVIFNERYTYPSGRKGTILRFKECLKLLKLDEARDIALSCNDPFRKRMLKKAWKRFNRERGPVMTYEILFQWLEKIKFDLREKIAPGVYKEYGSKLIRTSIHNLEKVDWKIVDNIRYKLSTTELRRLAKNGDERAIKMLDQAE